MINISDPIELKIYQFTSRPFFSQDCLFEIVITKNVQVALDDRPTTRVIKQHVETGGSDGSIVSLSAVFCCF